MYGPKEKWARLAEVVADPEADPEEDSVWDPGEDPEVAPGVDLEEAPGVVPEEALGVDMDQVADPIPQEVEEGDPDSSSYESSYTRSGGPDDGTKFSGTVAVFCVLVPLLSLRLGPEFIYKYLYIPYWILKGLASYSSSATHVYKL